MRITDAHGAELTLWDDALAVTRSLLAQREHVIVQAFDLTDPAMRDRLEVHVGQLTMTEHPDEQLRRIIASQPTAVSCRWSYPESASGRRCRAEADRMDEYADELDGDLVYGTGRIITNRSEQALADAADALRRSARELRADADDQDRLAVQHRKAGWT